MKPQLNKNDAVTALNHCYLLARNELREAELLAAKKYIYKLGDDVDEINVDKLSAVIHMLSAAVVEMRDRRVVFLSTEVEEVLVNLREISEHIQGDDAA